MGQEAVTGYISGEGEGEEGGEGVGANPSEPLNTCTTVINKCMHSIPFFRYIQQKNASVPTLPPPGGHLQCLKNYRATV